MDSLDLRAHHVKKQWWRERRLSPISHLGHPDYAHSSNHGISSYVEQMDTATLILIVSEAKKYGVDAKILSEWSLRAQRLSHDLSAVETSTLISGFTNLAYGDSLLYTTLIARLRRLCPTMTLSESGLSLLSVLKVTRHESIKIDLAARTVQVVLERDDHKAESLLHSFIALSQLDRNSSRSKALSKIMLGIRLTNLAECDSRLITRFAASCHAYFGSRGDLSSSLALMSMLGFKERWLHDSKIIGLFAAAAKDCQLEYRIALPNLPTEPGDAANWLCLSDISSYERLKLIMAATVSLNRLTVKQALIVGKDVMENSLLSESQRNQILANIFESIAVKLSEGELDAHIILDLLRSVDNGYRMSSLREWIWLKAKSRLSDTPIETLVEYLSYAPIAERDQLVECIFKRDMSALTVDELVMALHAASRAGLTEVKFTYSQAVSLLTDKLRASDAQYSSLNLLVALELPRETKKVAIHSLIYTLENFPALYDSSEEVLASLPTPGSGWSSRLRTLLRHELRKCVF